jgi:hypothetical protein
MGPVKALVKEDALYDAKTGKLIQAGLMDQRAIEAYSAHHYIVLPERDKKGNLWECDGQPVYCLHGAKYESLEGNLLHVARCPDCGGLAVRTEELTVESDCLRCTQCENEFDTRLEMMEN